MGKINVYDKIVMKNKKKKTKCVNIKNLYMNLRLKKGFGMELTAS